MVTMDRNAEHKEGYEAGVKDERERCAAIAAACIEGVAIEVNGEPHLLGCMQMRPVDAQRATASAIFEAIEAGTERDGAMEILPSKD